MLEIQFLPKSLDAELLVDPPTPARKHTPEWFVKTPAFRGESGKFQMDGDSPNTTVKLCQPMVDSYGMGYIQTTWTDILIEEVDGQITYSLPPGPENMSHRDIPSHEVSSDFYPTEFVWYPQWIPKVPKGYSVLYTHPLNREDLPFQTYSGVVDSDKFFYEAEGNHPFFIKRGFTGIIPAGTPMFQIIPFKRDDWKAVNLPTEEGHQIKAFKVRQKFWGGYKDKFWTKKTFI
jgi:hypothetical protein